MKDLITKYKIQPLMALIGALLLGGGFYILSQDISPLINSIAPYSLMITGLLAFSLIFGFSGIKKLFSKPADPNGNLKNFIKYFILAFATGAAAALIMQLLLKFNLAANPATDNFLAVIFKLPFMLLGEELISFYILIVVANLIYKQTNDNKKAEIWGIIISSIIFGLLHYTTYSNGSVVETLAHVLLIQGSARIAFNLSGLKANSIIMPLLIHIIYDIVFLGIGSL